MITYLSLGSNLPPRETYIDAACRHIEERVGPILLRSSDYYSEPWGFTSPNPFLNIALKVETELQPQELLHATQQIERELGREKKPHYADRTIDIDILLYLTQNGHSVQMQTIELTLPHPLMQQRDFVMIPLLEIIPLSNI